jgi:hypothetical protein
VPHDDGSRNARRDRRLPSVATRITLYDDANALASGQLDPASCVDLASDLLTAARVRLGRGAALESAESHLTAAQSGPATHLAGHSRAPLYGPKIDPTGRHS